MELALCIGYNLCASRRCTLRGYFSPKSPFWKWEIRYFLNFNKKWQKIIIIVDLALCTGYNNIGKNMFEAFQECPEGFKASRRSGYNVLIQNDASVAHVVQSWPRKKQISYLLVKTKVVPLSILRRMHRVSNYGDLILMISLTSHLSWFGCLGG